MKWDSKEERLEGVRIVDSTSTSKYILYRQLERVVPEYIAKLMNEVYTLDWVMERVPVSVCALDVKEDIDDYLGDVQYRVVDRLDEVDDSKKLERYYRMSVDAMVDKINGIPIAEKISLILSKNNC